MTRLYKLLILLTIISLSAIPSMAQSGQTSVTATVADSNGTLYINSPYTVTFYDPGTSGKLPLLNGSTFQKSYSGLATNSSGVLTISLPDNNVIASTSGATGTQWTFSICTAAASYTTIFCIPPVTITITGGSQDISAAITAVAPLLPTTLSNPYIANGNYIGNNTHSGTESFCRLDGMYVAGSTCYATIQAAETAACAATPDGTVYIPATYAGTDTFTYTTSCSAGYPSVDDKRRSASSASAVYSITYPSTDNMGRSLPLGADMSLYTAGSSDLHIKHGLVAATTMAALGIGANNNILISSVACPNCITALPFTGTANLYIGASLLIGRETANEENVPSGSWSIVDATHLNITCAKVHAGTTDVEQQMGSTFFDGGSEFIINPKAPAQSTHGSAARFFDGNGNLVFFYPGNSSDAWPYNGLQIFPSLTGALNSGVSSPDDLKLRNSSPSFCTKMVNSVGNGNIALFCDTLVTITKNTSFFGGGNTIFYSDQGVTPKVQITGTTGAVSTTGQITSTLATGTAPLVIASTTPVPNLTVNNCATCTLTTPTIGGGTTINLYKTVTDTPGAITVNNLTCTDRAVALAGSGTGAIIGIAAAYALDANIFVSPAQAVAGTLHYRICNASGGNITLNAAAAFNLMVLQ